MEGINDNLEVDDKMKNQRKSHIATLKSVRRRQQDKFIKESDTQL